MRKTPWFLTCSILLLALGTKAMAAKPFQQDSGPDGIVSIEAEHYDNKVDVGSNTWEDVTTATGFTATEGFSNGHAMLIAPDTPLGGRSVDTGYAAGSSHLDFNINFVKTGTYYVWLLAYGMDGNSDSAHAGLDGQEFDTSDRMSGWNAQYRWSNSTMDSAPSTFEVTQVGEHTLNMYMREDGLCFDKIVLTTNPSYTPTGHGPDESGRGVPDSATGAVPASGTTDVPRDVVLAWTAGPFAATHDVYFGTTLADVDAASRANPLNVLVSQDQSGTTYETAGLEYGQTYYWRVDEVNAAPDSTIFKGDLWMFTVEPYSYRLPSQSITATASSVQQGMDPANTANGAGLNAGDQHSVDGTQMWLSDGSLPNWIQYEFDDVYQLDEMWVWNSNQLIESIIGFGAKDVTIEYSVDGETWTELADVPEFARATGMATYTHNTTVSFGGVLARFVKLTINASWGGLPTTGLAEVRFFYTPVQARLPQPADDAQGVAIDATLSWRPGREAASHTVYFGTDANAVAEGLAPAQTVADHSFTPAALDFGTTYYWRVDEVNEAEVPGVYAGPAWSFTTQEYEVLDDFEAYNDDDNRIYETWIDGVTTGASGSTVGYLEAPFAEQTVVHGGKQAMPFAYDNAAAPYYSEGEHQWDTAQNWTANGADTLTLFFRGNPVGFLEPAPGSVTMSAGGADIYNTADEFRFAYKALNGDGAIVAKVESLDNTDPWAKAGVMIRESLDPGSRFTAVYATPGNGVRYQARLITGGSATSDTSVATAEQMALTTPVWIKIERAGSNFNCFYSSDGVKWTAMVWNPQTVNLGTSIYIGLAVTSHNSNAMTTASFSNVTTTGAATGAWTVQEIGPAQPVNDPAPLYVTVQDSAGKSMTIGHPDPSATVLSTWQEWQIPLSEFAAGGVKTTAVKKLTIGVGDRTSPKPGGAGLLYIDDIGIGHPAAQ